LSSTIAFPEALTATATIIRDTLPEAQLITGGVASRRLPPSISARHIDRLDGLLTAVDAMLDLQRRAGRADRTKARS